MDASLSSVVSPLRQASREMVRELGFLNDSCFSGGLSPSQCHALIELEAGRLNQSELAARLRLDRSTTSRLVKGLLAGGLAKAERPARDRRQTNLGLTAAGRTELKRLHAAADRQVSSALAELDQAEQAAALEGIRLYARALGRARAKERYLLRPITPRDDAGIERVIHTVMPEFGAKGPGFALSDPEVSEMARAYRRRGRAYFVLVDGDEVVGGGGVAPLDGGPPATCELRKMYFLPRVRGLGFGQALMHKCLDVARRLGYRRCYLETLKSMTQARALYERNGFRPLKKPEGSTGHFGCDAWYAKTL